MQVVGVRQSSIDGSLAHLLDGCLSLVSELIHHQFNSISVDVIWASNEVFLANVWELFGKTLFVEDFFRGTSFMLKHVEWSHNGIIAVLLAAYLFGCFAFIALVNTEVVIHLSDSLETSLNMNEPCLIEHFFFNHFTFKILINY